METFKYSTMVITRLRSLFLELQQGHRGAKASAPMLWQVRSIGMWLPTWGKEGQSFAGLKWEEAGSRGRTLRKQCRSHHRESRGSRRQEAGADREWGGGGAQTAAWG